MSETKEAVVLLQARHASQRKTSGTSLTSCQSQGHRNEHELYVMHSLLSC